MRFLGLRLSDPVPDANTIWQFREAVKKTGAIDDLFKRFDDVLRASGFLAMSSQIVDAMIVAAPKQRNTTVEKSHQGGADSRWLAAEPDAFRPKGPGCALEGQIYKSQAERGRIASAGRPRHPRVWLQGPYRRGWCLCVTSR